jgi:hypothetical protein
MGGFDGPTSIGNLLGNLEARLLEENVTGIPTIGN